MKKINIYLEFPKRRLEFLRQEYEIAVRAYEEDNNMAEAHDYREALKLIAEALQKKEYE
jgi:hypothetical protein